MISLYDIDVRGADGINKTMSTYEGDVLLLVNVASKCGYTPQYEGLEALHRKYADRGLRVLAFPSNDFGGQEPGTMEEIQQFCATNYGVTFEVLDKLHAIGEEQHPLYEWLTGQAEVSGDVQWNFEKFLITRTGQMVGRFVSKVKPDDAELVEAIERAL